MIILIHELREIERIPNKVNVDKLAEYRRVLEDWRGNDLVDRVIEGETNLVEEYDRRMGVVVDNGRLFYPNRISDGKKADIEELKPIVGCPLNLNLSNLIYNPVSFGLIGGVIGGAVIYGVQEAICLLSKDVDRLLSKNVDRKNFLKYIKNAYRVLLSRGMRGCYVYFMDKETEKFFRSRMNL